MRKLIFLMSAISVIVVALAIGWFLLPKNTPQEVLSEKVQQKELYWFVLHRESNREFLYLGLPGDKEKSKLVREFVVKAGVPGIKPTPLPQLVGRKYWRIVAKEDSSDNEETAPYFLRLDVPGVEEEPYGPVPYTECIDPFTQSEGIQCNWELPGYFGLHGVNGDNSRLSSENSGSSGCVRHTDEDITYLYQLLDPQKEEIRYYVENV